MAQANPPIGGNPHTCPVGSTMSHHIPHSGDVWLGDPKGSVLKYQGADYAAHSLNSSGSIG